MATTTLTIGELYLHIKAADLLAAHFDTMVAKDFEVAVEYRLLESRAEVKAIKNTATVHFAGDAGELLVLRGTDLLPLFSGPQVTALEDRIALMGCNDE